MAVNCEQDDFQDIVNSLTLHVTDAVVEIEQQQNGQHNKAKDLKAQLLFVQQQLQQIILSTQDKISTYSQDLDLSLRSSASFASTFSRERDDLLKKYRSLQDQLKRAEIEANEIKNQLEHAREKLSGLGQDLLQTEQELEAQEENLAQTTTHYASKISALRTQLAEFETSDNNLNELQTRYQQQWLHHKEAALAQLQETRGLLELERLNLQTRSSELETNVNTSQEKLSNLISQLDDVRMQQSSLSAQMSEGRAEYQKLLLQETETRYTIEATEKELKRLQEAVAEGGDPLDREKTKSFKSATTAELRRLKENHLELVEKLQKIKTLKLSPALDLQFTSEQRQARNAELIRVTEGNAQLRADISRYKEIYKKKCVQLFSAI
eukprot:TRINITY_DN19089_c0_g1_i1.p1 TRINITY_DN19089_c0_g1~~TRINITY_DN19089_c0_g1_i1.p1  ORF type:complete len:381 (-),score=97.27 TRINITY_DN19089_c0_g1_i1:29-1171(-)